MTRPGPGWLSQDEQMLAAVVAAQITVRQATFERQRAVRQGAPWETVRDARRAESHAVNERDRLLEAVAAHWSMWCHDSTDCVLCQDSTSATG